MDYVTLEDCTICKKLSKIVKCTTQDGEYTTSLSLPIYVYNRNRNGITAFVWHSGNEDDIVKKSSVGYNEGEEDKFYNEYPYLLDSLSLETIYGSFASLTKISEEAAARYIVRSLAHQPEGYRSVSVEGHLKYLLGGVLSYIESIISNADASYSGILKDEYFKRVEKLFQANSNSHLRYDANVSYTDLEDIDKNYLKDILGIRNNSNGCNRISTLLRRVFSFVSKMGITVDYVYCDIENIYSSARDLLVHRFKTVYQDKWEKENKGKITSAHPFYNEIILREIHWDDKFLPSLQALGYAFGDAGKELDDVASVLAGDDKEQLYYGITAGKTYERRRNLNVWDVVMKNYTSKLFYDYIFKPIANASKIASSKLPKEIKCTGHATFCAKGYLNRAERYETYLGGSLELPDGMYSNLSLYGDYMTKGARILNMDNWNILPKSSLFSFFMDNINRLRVIALSSKGKFNVFITSWNIWAYELNKELHFLKYNVINEEDPDKADKNTKIEELTKAYHKELLYHTFLLNPDKAIAYFVLERKGRKDDPESYIAIDENDYFKYAYNELNEILTDINKELGHGIIIPQTDMLAVETEPYVLSCAEVKNKWHWRLTVDELSNRDNIKKENGYICFVTKGRKITFSQVENNPLEDDDNNKVGFWIVTPINVRPQITSENDYYVKNTALSVDDKVLIEGKGVFKLVDSKKEGDISIPTDYVRLTFPYTQYTIFGELPIRHTISMRFCIKDGFEASCNLLHLSVLIAKTKEVVFSLTPVREGNKVIYIKAELLNVPNIIQPNFKIEFYDICELKISIDINPDDVKVEDGKSLLSGTVAYSLINETKKSNGEDSHSWSSGNIDWKYDAHAGIHYLVQELILLEYKARYGMLYNKETKSAVLFEDIVKKELNGIPEEYIDIKRKEIQKEKYELLLNSTPIRVENFSIQTHGHQEKVELFRESNGLNISRVKICNDSESEKPFTDLIKAKFSWLNAENKPVKYRLTFTLNDGKSELSLNNIVRPSTNTGNRLTYPKDGSLTIHKVTDKQIVLEVAPNSEGYMLFQITKNPVTITSAYCSCDEVTDETNPDAVYHVM